MESSGPFGCLLEKTCRPQRTNQTINNNIQVPKKRQFNLPILGSDRANKSLIMQVDKNNEATTIDIQSKDNPLSHFH